MTMSSPERLSTVLPSGCGCEQVKDRGRGRVGERAVVRKDGEMKEARKGRREKKKERELGGGSAEALGDALVHPMFRKEEK